jgi:hypothetical protein
VRRCLSQVRQPQAAPTLQVVFCLPSDSVRSQLLFSWPEVAVLSSGRPLYLVVFLSIVQIWSNSSTKATRPAVWQRENEGHCLNQSIAQLAEARCA